MGPTTSAYPSLPPDQFANAHQRGRHGRSTIFEPYGGRFAVRLEPDGRGIRGFDVRLGRLARPAEDRGRPVNGDAVGCGLASRGDGSGRAERAVRGSGEQAGRGSLVEPNGDRFGGRLERVAGLAEDRDRPLNRDAAGSGAQAGHASQVGAAPKRGRDRHRCTRFDALTDPSHPSSPSITESPDDPSRAGGVKRLAQTGRALLPGALAAWGIVALERWWAASGASGARPGWTETLLMAGILAAWSWTLLAASAGLAALRPSRVRPPASIRPRAAILAVVAALGTTGLVLAIDRWTHQAIAEAVVPHTLDVRPTFVQATAWALAVGAGTVLGTAVFMARQRGSPWWPRWLWGLQLVVLSVGASEPIDLILVLAGRAWWFDLGSLVLLLIAIGTVRARPRPAWFRAMIAAGAVAAAGSVLFLFAELGDRHGARAALYRQYPGPAGLVSMVRALFDTDGDGFSSVLGGLDCDDTDPTVFPGSLERVGNGRDDNCMGGDLAQAVPPVAPIPSVPQAKQSVVLITIDAWRADTLEARDDHGQPVMPNVMRFAADAAVLPRTYVQAPYTDDSLRSFLTGHYPMDISDGVHFFGQEKSLMEHFSEAGYATACLNQIWLFSPYGLMGCQHVDNELAIENRNFRGQTSPAMTDKALSVLRDLQAGDRPFFLWAHYFDPHSNYLAAPGAPIGGLDAWSRYLQELWFTDRALGRLLHALEQSGHYERGLVVITGDHGELVGEGGRMGHGWWLDEKVLRVPAMLRGPGVGAGRFETRVRLLDLYPTLLATAAGIGAPSDGRDLSPIWRGQETADRDVFVESRFHGGYQRAAIVGSWKLVEQVRSGVEYLYNLDLTPPENRDNQLQRHPAIAERLRQAIGQRWDQSMNDVVLRRKNAQKTQRLLPAEQILEYNRQIDRLQCKRGFKDACDRLQQDQ